MTKFAKMIAEFLGKITFWKSPSGRLMALSLAIVFASSVGFDQVSKFHVQKTLLISDMGGMDAHTYIPGKKELFALGDRAISPYFGMRLHYSRNTGAAFSMLADLPDVIRVPFFHIVTLLAIIMIGLYMFETPLHYYATRFGLIMILAGAIGNFLDRVQRGYVIDFISVDWNFFGWYHDFAIFNIADICINIGVILLIIELIVRRKEGGENVPAR